jgi:hypothetical protein
MEQPILTRHANERIQQRSISPFLVEMLLRFGAVEHDHHGAKIRYFDKKCIKKLDRFLGKDVARRVKESSDVYVIEAAETGEVITAGHRRKRIFKH